MADIFDAIAHPVRRTIMRGLLDGPASAAAIAESLALEKPEASRHLGVLRRAGLVVELDSPSGKLQRLDATALTEVEMWLTPFAEAAELQSSTGASVFSAWSGADLGNSLGRAAAERSHKVRSVIHDASEIARKKLPKPVVDRLAKSHPNGS